MGGDQPLFKLNIDASTDGGVFIQNDLLDGEVKAHVTVINTIEVPRLLGSGIKVAATVAWAPWFYSHVVTATVGLGDAANADAVRAALSGAAGVKVVDTPAESVYPMPALATGDEAVLVGRVRPEAIDSHAISLVIAADNVRMTAAHALAALRTALRARRAH